MQVTHYENPTPWLIKYLRNNWDYSQGVPPEFLAAWPEPDNPRVPPRWIVVRDDGGTDLDDGVQQARDIAFTVSAPVRWKADKDAEKLCALIRALPYTKNTPVTHIFSLVGPQPITDQTYPHLRYITCSLYITGAPINIGGNDYYGS